VLRLEQGSSRILLLRNKEMLVRGAPKGTTYRRKLLRDKIVWTSIDFRNLTKITSCLPKPNDLNGSGGPVDGH
jgi:hypothetical protein